MRKLEEKQKLFRDEFEEFIKLNEKNIKKIVKRLPEKFQGKPYVLVDLQDTLYRCIYFQFERATRKNRERYGSLQYLKIINDDPEKLEVKDRDFQAYETKNILLNAKRDTVDLILKEEFNRKRKSVQELEKEKERTGEISNRYKSEIDIINDFDFNNLKSNLLKQHSDIDFEMDLIRAFGEMIKEDFLSVEELDFYTDILKGVSVEMMAEKYGMTEKSCKQKERRLKKKMLERYREINNI